MRNDDEHKRPPRWSVADQPRDNEPDDVPEVAVEDIQRRLCRERMLGLWRSAVECVGDVARVQQDLDEPRRGTWTLPPSNGLAN